MLLYGFLTVSTVLSLLSTSTHTLAITTSPVLETSVSGSLLLHRNNGREASSDTSSSSSSEAAAEYSGSEPAQEACNCGDGDGSILDSSSVVAPASVISSSFVTTTIIILASTSSSQQPQSRITSPPQQVSYSSPAPTSIGPSVVTPGQPNLPSTITPAPSAPPKAEQEGGKGQKWHQVTYWECVTWPSDYVHCGWHTPLRMGENPDPGGETFVYGAGSSPRASAWLMGMVGAGVALTLML